MDAIDAGPGRLVRAARLFDVYRPAAPTAAAPMPGTLPRYRSPLDDYRPYRVDEPLLPWREANDAVGGLGGHMGHLERPAHGGGQ